MVAPKGNPTNMLYDTLFTLDLNAKVIEGQRKLFMKMIISYHLKD